VKARNVPVLLNGEVKITVLTPTTRQVDRLQQKWLVELIRMFPEVKLNDDKILDDALLCVTEQMEEDGIDDSECIAGGTEDLIEGSFREDRSVINASSITFIIEFLGMRLLFLADSPPSEVLTQLKNLYPDMSPENPQVFDAIKVSHHGSKANTNKKLMEHISSERFLFSACGTYGHPHIEAVARILKNSTSKQTRKLYFNYDTNTSRGLNREDWMQKYKYTCHIGQDPILIPIDEG
jgi:hypothetical protein